MNNKVSIGFNMWGDFRYTKMCTGINQKPWQWFSWIVSFQKKGIHVPMLLLPFCTPVFFVCTPRLYFVLVMVIMQVFFEWCPFCLIYQHIFAVFCKKSLSFSSVKRKYCWIFRCLPVAKPKHCKTFVSILSMVVFFIQ